MGLYDQLEHLDKTPPVAAPVSVKTPEPVKARSTQPKPKNAVINGAAAAQHGSARVSTSHSASEPTPTANLAEPHVVKKRIINRASFEVFQDQYHVLRQVSLEAKLTGDDLSISEMVREALDDYIHRHALRP